VSLTPGFDQGMLAFDTHYLTPGIEQEIVLNIAEKLLAGR